MMTTMFKEAGFSLKSALNSLMPSYLPGYGHLDGPLHESWRNNNSFWGLCTESEIQDMRNFFEKHDQVYKVGACEIFAAKKETF